MRRRFANRPRLAVIDLATAQRRLGVDVVAVPKNLAVVGWDADAEQWLVSATPDALKLHRVQPLVAHLQRALLGSAPRPTFWFLCCVWDGWRERALPSDSFYWVDPPDDIGEMAEWQGPPGSIPRLSATHDGIMCFSAHVGDPSAVLLPEAHWLRDDAYRSLFAQVAKEQRPWESRRNRAMYAGGDHGNPESRYGELTARQYVRNLAKDERLPLDVILGYRTSRREQLGYKYLLDIDGFARTWDAWAWKLVSGSVVLSPASDWETTFTRAFSPWEHFIPVSADFADLADRLAWCVENDDECERMGQRARLRALEVYAPTRVEGQTRAALVDALGLPASQD